MQGQIPNDFTAKEAFTFVVNTVCQCLFIYLWGFINTLQLILYLPMLNVYFPKNVKLFYSILLPLANADIIPPEISTMHVFEISDDLDNPYNDILEEMGYETHNVILNMGSLFIYLGLLLTGLVSLIPLKLLTYKYSHPKGRVVRVYTFVKKQVFWKMFLALFINSYIENRDFDFWVSQQAKRSRLYFCGSFIVQNWQFRVVRANRDDTVCIHLHAYTVPVLP